MQLLREVGNDDSSQGQLRQVKYLSPFYGVTSVANVGGDPDADTYNETQKSYGMWAIPPDVGTIVMCIFVNGDPKRGYWIGCVPDENMNFMVPGVAATRYVTEDSKSDKKIDRVPVAEYNKKIQTVITDPTKFNKPEHPFAATLTAQGLIKDDIRGITSSSARREVPSSVFGISTPGPIDKRADAKKGKVGKAEHKITNAFVSRLGGTTFVMDDGDDKFCRKKDASNGPPEYVSIEQKETGGDQTIPHNELVRIRTRTGHQILLHNSEDLIYIGNSKGTAWIELTSDGKIDIYAEDSISIRTKKDFNFYADRDINLEAGRNINMKSGGNTVLHAVGNKIVVVGGNHQTAVAGGYDANVAGSIKMTSGGTNETKAGGNIVESAPKIHMNGPGAATAAKPTALTTHTNPDLATHGGTASTKTSIMKRMPTAEPYAHHENLDPLKFKPTQTDREVAATIPPSTFVNKYTTSVDTFEKILPPAQDE